MRVTDSHVHLLATSLFAYTWLDEEVVEEGPKQPVRNNTCMKISECRQPVDLVGPIAV